MKLAFYIFIANVFAESNGKNPAFSIINPIVRDDDGGIVGGVLRFLNIDKAIEQNMPVLMRDFHKFWVFKEPVKVESKKPRKGASIEEVKENYLNSLLPDCTPDQLKSGKCVCKETYPEIYAVESQSIYSQGAVAANRKLKKLIIAYRGTKNMQNSLLDLSYSLMDSPNLPYGAQIGEGFYSYHLSIFHSLSKLLEPMLDNPDYEDYTIQITGYSLGAAAAMSSISDWMKFLKERNDHHKLEYIGYSGPRSGNPEFAKYINELGIPITRYTNFKDYVPQVPPRSVNFAHAGVEVYQNSEEPVTNSSKNLKICSTEYDEDPNCNWFYHDKADIRQHVTPFGEPLAVPPFC